MMWAGLIAVVIIIFILWGKETAKAAKDADVIEASELGIPIWRYRKYKEAWKQIQEIYKEYGTNNSKANQMVSEIIKKLPNMNEWRAYGEKQNRKTFFNSYEDALKYYDEAINKGSSKNN